MLTLIALPAANHVLRTHSWAMDRLRVHTGKTAQLECGPVRELACVLPDGGLAEPPPHTLPDAIIRLTPGRLLRVLARDDTVWSEIETEGDTALATTLIEVWRNVDWDIEEDLSAVFGDIAAHRLSEAGRRALAWGRYAVRNASQSVAEYWTEERPLVTQGRDIALFRTDVDRLRNDVARLDERVQDIANRLARNSATGDH